MKFENWGWEDMKVMKVIASRLREAFKSNFWKNLGIWPNQVDPRPPPQKLGRPKLKKKIDVYFAF